MYPIPHMNNNQHLCIGVPLNAWTLGNKHFSKYIHYNLNNSTFRNVITCIWALDLFLLMTSARYCRTFSRVFVFFRRHIRTSDRPSYKLFMTVLIVENEDKRSAGRRVDASAKHCWLICGYTNHSLAKLSLDQLFKWKQRRN